MGGQLGVRELAVAAHFVEGVLVQKDLRGRGGEMLDSDVCSRQEREPAERKKEKRLPLMLA